MKTDSASKRERKLTIMTWANIHISPAVFTPNTPPPLTNPFLSYTEKNPEGIYLLQYSTPRPILCPSPKSNWPCLLWQEKNLGSAYISCISDGFSTKCGFYPEINAVINVHSSMAVLWCRCVYLTLSQRQHQPLFHGRLF